MGEFDFNPAKFEQAILYFLHTVNNGLLGKTKLFKLLYFADFDHFERHGSPITGETYLKFEHGPFPEHGDDALSRLNAMERISAQQVSAGPYKQFAYTPLVEFDLSGFTANEILTLVDVTNKWERHSAREIVAATHGEAPWIATANRQAIPYAMAYYRNKFGEMNEFAEEDSGTVEEFEQAG
jgi:uncharacterized phage-associated protein